MGVPTVNVIHGRRYKNRQGDLCEVGDNEYGWLDGLPFIVKVVQHNTIGGALGFSADEYTVNHEGIVYPTCENPYGWCKQDLVKLVD